MKIFWKKLGTKGVENDKGSNSDGASSFVGGQWREIQIRDNGQTRKLIVPVKDKKVVDGR